MKSNWIIEKENIKLRDKLSKGLKISPITAQILINRGIENETEANLFLNCTLFDLPSPYLMKGMDIAIERIKKGLSENERIAIYGDYDVDGVTSTALLYNFLKDINANVTYYNPDRIKEGYGINFEAVKKLSEDGVGLIISGDCGITAVKEVEQAKELGVDFIVTDHHKPPEELPQAVSVLNPKLKDCKYPAKEIVGVGVIFNLVIALRRALRDEGFFENGEPNLGDYLDLVALGTVADCAPLLDVNRILVKEGIKRMQTPK
ncbi:MAG: DHH family phosphoesterase, partial [Thermodesulfobacteriota bacterium]